MDIISSSLKDTLINFETVILVYLLLLNMSLNPI